MENVNRNSSTGTVLVDGSPGFMAVARERAAKDGQGITAAMRAVAHEQPELHSDFLQRAQGRNMILEKNARGKGNKEFMQMARARANRVGVTMTEAMRSIAHEHPWLYAGDIPEQPATTPVQSAPAQASTQPDDSEPDDDE